MIKKYKQSIDTGLSFGLTSGVITTVGLMVGVFSGTQSQAAVLSSIVTIAIADAMSDAMGIHIAEESRNNLNTTEIWISTVTTFISKFLISLSFIVPIFLFELKTAVVINIAYGTLLLIIHNYLIGLKQKRSTVPIIAEHLLIATLVVFIAYSLGRWINYNFNQ